MKRFLAISLVVVVLLLPVSSLAIDLGSLGDTLGSLFGVEEKKVEIDQADIPKGVSQEFYEKMVSLEQFFDEYVEFMDTYTKSNDTSKMMTDYLSFVTKYTDAMTSLDEIDEKKLAKAEKKYYTEVLLRINTKMAQYALTLN